MTDQEITNELIKRAREEERECLQRISDFVQERIVPKDFVFYIVHCRTIDVAIEHYINLLEHDIKILKLENEKLKR